ncbi:MAG: hypothetical protein PHU63_04275, partial [Candidatus ainarchaeum sp.]|nr:hypothetical protein [Candidatus ainarchaeum sp.]
MKKIYLLFLIFGLVFSGLSITGVSVSPDPIVPGGYATITATISSTMTVGTTGSVVSGGDTIKQVKLLFYSYGAVENVPSSILIGDLDPGASTTISVPIKIRDDATSGNYLFKIEATGFVDATSSSGASEYNEKSATVVLNVINSPLITLETEKTVIGDKENFNLIIQNNGGNAKNLKISVSDEFAIEGTDKVYVGEVEKYKEVNFVLDSSNAKA